MGSKADIWMPLYIGDYLSDTAHLSTEESGAYLHLLMHYWRTGPLSHNERALAQVTRLSVDAWSNARVSLLGFFTLGDDGMLHQKRIDEEMERWSAKQKKAKDKAVKAAETRWGKEGEKDAPSIAQDQLELCPLPLPLPLPITKKDIRRFTSAHVDAIYQAYPKKAEPRAAKKAIESALQRIEGDTPGEDLLKVVNEYAASPQGSLSDRELIKNPATWFNKGCYLESWKDWQIVRRSR